MFALSVQNAALSQMRPVCRSCFRLLATRLSSESTNADIIRSLKHRGLVATSFPDDLLAEANSGRLNSIPAVVYTGFDPTSASLHLGHLVVLNAMLRLYASGFKVLFVIGGATAKVGDPSGVNIERPLLEQDVYEANGRSIKRQIERVFDHFQQYHLAQLRTVSTAALKQLQIVNNADWYSSVNVIDFMQNVGRRLRVSQLLHSQAVQQRLSVEKQGMNFAELSYQLFQAYDWLQLFKQHHCRLQLGGSDQQGNVHAGHDMIKKAELSDVYGLFVPLLTNDKGEKLGKSTGSALYLDAQLTSPFELYQSFMRLQDVELQKHFRLLTFYPAEQIEQIYAKHLQNSDTWYAHNKLAQQVVRLLHGQHAMHSAQRCSDILYGKSLEQMSRLSVDDLQTLSSHMQTHVLEFVPGMTALDMCGQIRCFRSEAEMRNNFAQGGMRLNNVRIFEPQTALVPGVHIFSNGLSLLRVSKKQRFLLKWTMQSLAL